MYKDLKLTRDNVDIYFPLRQKYDLIKKISGKYFSDNFVDIGCGKMPYKDIITDNVSTYTGVDIENEEYQKEQKPDAFWDGVSLPFSKENFDSGMLIEVLEHVPNPENTLKEINRVLKNDSYLLITVPFLWTLHDVPYDEYRYTPFALRRILENNNFDIVEMEAFGNWHASIASSLALYTRRAPLNPRRRKLLSLITYPIIKYLNKLDQKADHKNFTEGMMITGLWCLAKVNKNI